jgi:hypothetical protein
LPFDPAALNKNPNQSAEQTVSKILDWVVKGGQSDLAAASTVTKAANDNAMLPCWQALQTFASRIQALPPIVRTTQVIGVPTVASFGAGGGTGTVTLTGTTDRNSIQRLRRDDRRRPLRRNSPYGRGLHRESNSIGRRARNGDGAGAETATGVQLVLNIGPVPGLPKLHLAVDIEVATNLLIALRPNSPVIAACSARANFQKKVVVTLVTQTVTGVSSVATLGPIIP